MKANSTQRLEEEASGMAVPRGYKRTDVGVIPTEWEIERIGELALIKTGSKNTQDQVPDGAYPFFVRSQVVERINSYSFDGEAVLTAGDGVGTGRVFHYVVGRFDVHQRVYRISNFSNRLNGRFFFYQFSQRFYHRVASMTAKSSVDSVRMNMIADMWIPLPSVPEQQAIAAALSDADALLEALDQLIAKKQAMKQGAMQQLLTDKTRFTQFKDKWKVTQLGAIGSFSKGRGLPKSDLRSSGGLPAISYTEIYTNFAEVIDYKKIRSFTDPQENASVIDSPHLLIAGSSNMLANVGKTTAYDDRFSVAVGGDIILFKTTEDVRFLSYLLAAPSQRKRIVFLSQGSTIHHVYASMFEGYEIALPSRPEQEAIATVLSDIDAEILSLEQRREKVKAIKQGMMQVLLTGNVRLVKPEVTG